MAPGPRHRKRGGRNEKDNAHPGRFSCACRLRDGGTEAGRNARRKACSGVSCAGARSGAARHAGHPDWSGGHGAEARAQEARGDQSRVDRALRLQQGDAHRLGQEDARCRGGGEAAGLWPDSLHQRQRARRSPRLRAIQPEALRATRRSRARLSRLQGRRCCARRDVRLRQDDAGQVLPRPEGSQGADRMPRAQPSGGRGNPGLAPIGKRPEKRFVAFPRWLIPVEPAGRVLTDHAVAVRDGKIEAVLPAAEARQRFADYAAVDLADHALIPGLVNAHTHAAMSLMRGLADDLPLMGWLQEHIWPAEKRHVSADFVRDGTLLACAEMLRGGITCFNDMYFFPDAALESALEAGMRASHGIIVIEFPSTYASDPADYLRKGLAIRDR